MFQKSLIGNQITSDPGNIKINAQFVEHKGLLQDDDEAGADEKGTLIYTVLDINPYNKQARMDEAAD